MLSRRNGQSPKIPGSSSSETAPPFAYLNPVQRLLHIVQNQSQTRTEVVADPNGRHRNASFGNMSTIAPTTRSNWRGSRITTQDGGKPYSSPTHVTRTSQDYESYSSKKCPFCLSPSDLLRNGGMRLVG